MLKLHLFLGRILRGRWQSPASPSPVAPAGTPASPDLHVLARAQPPAALVAPPAPIPNVVAVLPPKPDLEAIINHPTNENSIRFRKLRQESEELIKALVKTYPNLGVIRHASLGSLRIDLMGEIFELAVSRDNQRKLRCQALIPAFLNQTRQFIALQNSIVDLLQPQDGRVVKPGELQSKVTATTYYEHRFDNDDPYHYTIKTDGRGNPISVNISDPWACGWGNPMYFPGGCGITGESWPARVTVLGCSIDNSKLSIELYRRMDGDELERCFTVDLARN